MKMDIQSSHTSRPDGTPGKSKTCGTGFIIDWHYGPEVKGQMVGSNVETILDAALDRLEFEISLHEIDEDVPTAVLMASGNIKAAIGFLCREKEENGKISSSTED